MSCDKRIDGPCGRLVCFGNLTQFGEVPVGKLLSDHPIKVWAMCQQAQEILLHSLGHERNGG